MTPRMQSLSYRGTTIAVSMVALVANVVSACLFNHLPDDPYHIATSFLAYSQFASVLSLVGLLGALKEHAYSVAIFGIYVLIDATLCAIPRFLAVAVFSGVQDLVCSPGSTFAFEDLQLPSPIYQDGPQNMAPSGLAIVFGANPIKCERVMWTLEILASVWMVGATVIQFVLALQVREYGHQLFALCEETVDCASNRYRDEHFRNKEKT